MKWIPGHPAFVALLNALATEIDPVYVVGGVVRDALLNRAQGLTDLDVIVVSQANTVARRVADRLGWAYYALDPERDVARLVFTASKTPLVCDIAAMRGGELTIDLQSRDFTVNAMALRWRRNAASDLVDLADGQRDLAMRLLRRVTPWNLADDPVRLLRAVRLAAQLDFTIEEETLLQILRIGDTLRLASPERVRDELWKMLASAAPDRALEMLRSYRLLHVLLPEVAEMEGVEQSAPHDADVYQHTLRAVRYAVQLRDWLKDETAIDGSPAGSVLAEALAPHLPRLRQVLLATTAAERRQVDWLVWFALWHDVGKPTTRSVDHFADGALRYRFLGHEEAGAEIAGRRIEALKFSRYEASLVQSVIRAHMRPHHLHASFGADPLSRRACYRFFRDSGPANLGRVTEAHVGIDTVLLALADYQAIFAASPPPEWPTYVRHVTELIAFGLAPDGLQEVRTPLVDGHTLMAYFKLTPGQQVGVLLEQLREAQAAGEIATPEEGLELAAELLTGTV
ncbi:MAG: HD domain-containing protein [Caldilinea sp.]